MDDLREEDVWDKIESTFPDEANGSRILLTTRVCTPRGGTSHDTRILNGEESWRLLSKRVFSGEAQKNLEAIGRDIAAQCEGMPLSITLLGSILARKEQTNAAWSKLQETLRLSSMKGGGGKPINFTLLNYVYKSLPDHLGSCFLYFGMFPSGIEIPARQLIQLWIAEGFIQMKGALPMENVGEEYLEDLICLSLVQVATRRTDGGVKSCKIHDSFQEYCISKGINRKFFQVGATTNSASVESTKRLAIHVDSVQDASISHLRSTYSDVHSFQLSVQDPVANLVGQQWNLLRDGFRFLRVLNLGFVSVHRIPGEVGKLFHLRYLRIRSPRSKHVPHSICNLLNLQTLDVRESSVSSIPKGIWKMQQLRHLCLGYLPSLPEPDEISMKALGSLQTLSSIRPNRVAKRLMVKAKFPNLRKLKLFSQSKQETLEFLKSLDHLIHLESLKIVSEANLKSDTNIIGLLPDPNAFPSTLTKITLLDTHLNAGALNKLEMLPNLQILKLHRNSVVGEEMSCNAAGGFPQLQVLQLKDLEIKRWTLEGNTMRNLRHLVISKCISLTVIPDHTNWAKMQEVELFLPTNDLKESVQQFIIKRGCKVHIQPSPAIHTTGENTVTSNSPP